MQLTRDEAISSLLEEESIEIHGCTSYELYNMPKECLTVLLNNVFEPIDLEDPFTVEDFILTRH